ncbi:DUF3048 C-terminal domain-containing protein [Clostridium sp.]
MFITHISYNNIDEITISKYTGERVVNTPDKASKIATYINTNNKPYIKGISRADVVLEFLSKTHGITYKAIFAKEDAKSIGGATTINDYYNSYLPNFSFSPTLIIPGVKDKNASKIFVSFSEDLCSNFIYENGEYTHYRGLHIDKDTNAPVVVSNVIVQFINGSILNEDNLTSSEDYGTGLLFSSGLVQDIKWSRKKNSPIEIIYSNGNKVSLMSGHTWWIFIDKSCSVAYD